MGVRRGMRMYAGMAVGMAVGMAMRVPVRSLRAVFVGGGLCVTMRPRGSVSMTHHNGCRRDQRPAAENQASQTHSATIQRGESVEGGQALDRVYSNTARTEGDFHLDVVDCKTAPDGRSRSHGRRALDGGSRVRGMSWAAFPGPYCLKGGSR